MRVPVRGCACFKCSKARVAQHEHHCRVDAAENAGRSQQVEASAVIRARIDQAKDVVWRENLHRQYDAFVESLNATLQRK